MKKLFTAIILSLILSSSVTAFDVEVEAMSDFSTDNPPEVFSIKVVNMVYTVDEIIKGGSIVEGKIITQDARRLKRDATFSFIPTTLITPEGDIFQVKKECIGKYKKEGNKGKIIKSIALTAGNFTLFGFSIGYSLIEGFCKNQYGNRLKSSVITVYDNSLLSYIKKGKPTEIKQGDHFIIEFEDENEPEAKNTDETNDTEVIK